MPGVQELRRSGIATGRRERDRTRTIVADRARERVHHTLEWKAPDAGSSVRAAPAATEPGPAGTDRIVADRYRLGTLLGAGGMGEVWLAEDTLLRRAVALKHVTSQQRDAWPCGLEEARAAARVSHPGVVRVYDVILDADDEWIVMEALPGEPLSTVIRERGRLPVEEVTSIALQLLSALTAIHDAGLVHRDIKPSNVQICGAGRIVITDFGLSSPGGELGGLRTGVLAGSLPYMAPETITDGSVGPASDLYALGVTLYVALEGHQPFDLDTPSSVVESVLSETPPPAAHAGALRTVLDGLLEKDPARRMDAARTWGHLQMVARATPQGRS